MWATSSFSFGTLIISPFVFNITSCPYIFWWLGHHICFRQGCGFPLKVVNPFSPPQLQMLWCFIQTCGLTVWLTPDRWHIAPYKSSTVLYTAGSTLCAKRGEARGNECELCLVYGPVCDGMMTQGWKIQVRWPSWICLGFAALRKCFCGKLAIVCSVFQTRDMTINSKAKSNHHPSASDHSVICFSSLINYDLIY